MRISLSASQLDEPGRGDLIVFTDPGGWLPAGYESSQFIKRVIGVGGDHVTCCDEAGRLSVNGVALDEPYVDIPPASEAVAEKPFDVVVPQGCLFVPTCSP